MQHVPTFKPKKKELSAKGSIVDVLIDEVQSVQYCNGKFCGMEEDGIVKTLLCHDKKCCRELQGRCFYCMHS